MSKDEDSCLSLSIFYHGTSHSFSFPLDASITDLSNEIAQSLHVPASNQKFIISQIGILKLPFKDPGLLLSSLVTRKITLLGSTFDEVSSISTASEDAARRVYQRNQFLSKPTACKSQDWKKVQEESQYTFLELQPLNYLPNPTRSLQLLQRLKDDAGIKAVMRKHKFTVPLLTEMNPSHHTLSNHEGTSRTLGLNRDKGKIIELRLRTDAFDGYRDYKTIRKTLCHELAHNVHQDHSRDFWDLCSQIEKEVEKADWRSGGRVLGHQEMVDYRDDIQDRCGYIQEEHVLGVSAKKKNSSFPYSGDLTRREIIANAAENRKRQIVDKQCDQTDDTTKK